MIKNVRCGHGRDCSQDTTSQCQWDHLLPLAQVKAPKLPPTESFNREGWVVKQIVVHRAKVPYDLAVLCYYHGISTSLYNSETITHLKNPKCFPPYK